MKNLNNDERIALAEFVGIISGLYEDTQYTNIEVEETDKKILHSVYDVLDDEYTYPEILIRLIEDDIPVLKKYLDIAWDNGDIEGNYDLQDAMDKITN